MSGAVGAGQIVAFDPAAFIVAYPEFATLDPARLTEYFNIASGYVDNTTASPVVDGSPGGQRATFLNLVTAHIAALLGGVNGAAPSGLAGAISSASEGSVSVAVQLPASVSEFGAFFGRTTYGQMFLAVTKQYRWGFYRPGPQPSFSPLANLGGPSGPYGLGGVALTYPFLNQ